MFKPIQNGIFVFVVSIIYSLIEIEMEGKNGWCTHLPTAKNVISSFTLYHLLMMALVFVIFYQMFHKKDIWIMIFYITMFFFIEDFLWFVLNPYFTIKNYNKENITWHKTWISGQPLENYICYGIVLLTYFNTKFKKEQMNSILYIALLIAITVSLAPFYHLIYVKLHGKLL